jgi:uncharacterized protein YfaT (DUF1175 family)
VLGAIVSAEREALRKDADIVQRARARSSVVVEVTPELLTKDAFTAQPLHVMLTDNGDGTHLLTFRESEELHILRSRLKAFEKERDALRKDAARYRWLSVALQMDWDLGNPLYLSLGCTVEVPEHIKICFDLDATLDTLLENAVEATP